MEITMTELKKLQGHRVKRLREAMGYTMEELAALLGVDKRQIVRFEKPDANPKAVVVVQLATALNTSSDYLLGLTDDPSPKTIVEDLSAEERALIWSLRHRQSAEAIESFAKLSRSGK